MRVLWTMLPAIVAASLAAPAPPGYTQQLGVQSDGRADPYIAVLSKKIRTYAIFPSVVRHAMGGQCVVWAVCSLRRDGKLAGSRILRTSGSEVVDDGLLDGIRRAAPFPPPPSNFQGDPVEIALQFDFTYRRR